MISEAVKPSGNQDADRPTFVVKNPATGETLAELPIQSPEEVREVFRRARLAQSAWAALSPDERARYLLSARKYMMGSRAKMVNTVVAENGKPPSEVLLEIAYMADLIGYYSKNARKFLADEKVGLHLYKNKRGMIIYRPYGVAGIITPWNFPLVLGIGDVIAALLAGNAVVLKPSEITPLTSILMGEFLKQANLPQDVFQIVTGLGETGATVVDEADIVAFTGSVPTGKKVMEQAAKSLKPVLLELGGKDPFIVLKDADLTRASKAAVYGSMFNAGQMCISVETAYVEAPVYDRFLELVLKEVAKIRVGQSHKGSSVDMGPLTMPRQLEIVERQVADARAKGAKILTGGKRRTDLPGLFYEPTIVTGVTSDMLLMQEETFGPVLPIIKVESAEEAVRLVNQGQFGLSSSIWTKDKKRGENLAKQVEAGSTCVNDVASNYVALELPFGGVKQSGIGYRHGGADGLRHFCRKQGILVDRLGLKRELYWFPYSRRVEILLDRALGFVFKR